MKVGMRKPSVKKVHQRQDHRQMEKAGQESHHPGLRQERHGMGEEPEEGSL